MTTSKRVSADASQDRNPGRTDSGEGSGVRLRSVLCAVDRNAVEGGALDTAIDLACAHRGRLTLLAAAGRVPTYAYMAGLNPDAILSSLHNDAKRWLQESVSRAPWDLEVVTLLRDGCAARVIAAEVKSGRHDAVVASGSRYQRWRQSRRSRARKDGRLGEPVWIFLPQATATPLHATSE
jgi:hypothetical protein